METIIKKKLNRDMTNEELLYFTHQWQVELEFLEHELLFYKHLLNSNIYKKNTMNLFENLQLYKKEGDNYNKERLEILDKVHTYKKQILNRIACDDLSCDSFYLQLHEKMTYDVEVFLEESKNFKFHLFEYIQSVILV